MEEVSLSNNFTVEVSGNIMSLGWKPRHGSDDNLISFVDGQAFYSSTYLEFNDLRDKQDRIPHIVLNFDDPLNKNRRDFRLINQLNLYIPNVNI